MSQKNDDGSRLDLMRLLVELGEEPAFLKRSQDAREAVAQLYKTCAQDRELMLEVPRIHLGEQAEVMITVARLDEALLVPETAVSAFDGRTGMVWTVQGGRLSRAEVSFGHRSEDARLEVISGLPAGARIIAAPVAGLKEGRAARIVERASS